jgi:hypothetical protein
LPNNFYNARGAKKKSANFAREGKILRVRVEKFTAEALRARRRSSRSGLLFSAWADFGRD